MRLLYERHADALFSFVRAQLIDQFDAADAVQEAFLEVWRTAARFAGHSSVRTWLFSIALNKAVDLRRRRARVVPGDAEASLVDDAQCPHALLQAARDAAVVRACISRLSDRHRSAIHLAFYEELSYHDIAAIEGVPVGTIRTRIHHARRWGHTSRHSKEQRVWPQLQHPVMTTSRAQAALMSSSLAPVTTAS